MNDSHIVVAKENIKNVWRELLQFIRNAKESASTLTDPRILGEQLQIIFRDESKWPWQLIGSNEVFIVCFFSVEHLQLLEIISFLYASD